MKEFIASIVMTALLLFLVACTAPYRNNHDVPNLPSDTETISDTGSYPIIEPPTENFFTELLLIDNPECSVSVTNIDPEGRFGYTLKVHLENKSIENIYTFSLESLFVNDVKCSAIFSHEVAPGQSASETITFAEKDLKKHNITEYTDLELTFKIFDDTDVTVGTVAKETVHVYPQGEENATKFIREPQSTDRVLFDNEYVTAIVIGYEVQLYRGYTANLFLVNKTNADVMFTADNASVNGVSLDPFYACKIPAGKSAFSDMSWLISTLEDNNIYDITEVKFNFRAYEEDDYFGTNLAVAEISLNP